MRGVTLRDGEERAAWLELVGDAIAGAAVDVAEDPSRLGELATAAEAIADAMLAAYRRRRDGAP